MVLFAFRPISFPLVLGLGCVCCACVPLRVFVVRVHMRILDDGQGTSGPGLSPCSLGLL
jgi:hypothetical protein